MQVPETKIPTTPACISYPICLPAPSAELVASILSAADRTLSSAYGAAADYLSTALALPDL